MASLAIKRGVRIADEAKRLPPIVAAIQFLARPGRSRKVIARKAKVLLAAWDETSIIETFFTTRRSARSDLWTCSNASSRAERSSCGGSRRSRPRLRLGFLFRAGQRSAPRRRRINFCLKSASSVTGVRGYTWNDCDEDFADPLTQATRQEFDRTDFDPRPARRRSRRLSAAPKTSPHRE